MCVLPMRVHLIEDAQNFHEMMSNHQRKKNKLGIISTHSSPGRRQTIQTHPWDLSIGNIPLKRLFLAVKVFFKAKSC